MVHYNGEQQAAPALPPICPKCGSHRTEVVGRSNDAQTLTLRCNACGERSVVTVDRSTAAATTDTTAEVDAIRAISVVLSQLDPAARVRVLTWAQQRFSVAVCPGETDRVAPATAPSDQLLAMGDLGELFTEPKPAIAAADLALDPEMFGDDRSPRTPDTPANAGQHTPPSSGPAGEQEFDSLVRSFVSDLQQLAREWGTVFKAGRATA